MSILKFNVWTDKTLKRLKPHNAFPHIEGETYKEKRLLERRKTGAKESQVRGVFHTRSAASQATRVLSHINSFS